MLNNFAKKIKILILLVFTFILTGCATVEYKSVVYPNGEMVDTISVRLDTQKLTQANYNVSALAEVIHSDIVFIFLTNIQTFKTESWINNDLSIEEKQNIRSNIAFDANISDDKSLISGYIHYKNKEAYNSYVKWINKDNTPEEEPTEKEPTIVKGAFFNTQVEVSSSVYASYLKSQIASTINNKYGNTLGLGNEFSVKNDVNLYQVYGNANDKIKSNATQIKMDGIIKLHYWKLNPENTTQNLEFYYHTPNTPNWYLSAIGIALVSVIIIYVHKILSGKHLTDGKQIFFGTKR